MFCILALRINTQMSITINPYQAHCVFWYWKPKEIAFTCAASSACLYIYRTCVTSFNFLHLPAIIILLHSSQYHLSDLCTHFQPQQQQPAMTRAFLWTGLAMGTVRSLVTAWRFSAIQATSCKVRTPSHVCGWRTDSTGNLTLQHALVGEHCSVIKC